MKSQILALALGASAAAAQRVPSSQCDDVHVFIAKGNNEPYPGRQGVLVSAICKGVENCDYEDIQFYNPKDSPYCESVAEGASNGVAQITQYNARCPDTKLVVSGYSQGGQIVGDVLGGGGGVLFDGCQQPANAGISANSAAGKKIAAVLIFGDVRKTRGQSYNFLNGGNTDGALPRPANQLANLNGYADRMRNYCDATDPVCAGGSVVANHLNYFEKYTNSAAAWVQEKLAEAPETDNKADKPKATKSSSSVEYAPAPTTMIAPKHMNGTVYTTVCPELTSALEGVASSTKATTLTFAPIPKESEVSMDLPGVPATEAAPTEGGASPTGEVEMPPAEETPATAGASTMQKTGLGLAVMAISAFALF